MFGWSINLFRIRGIQLSMHVSFLLLLAYAGFEGWRDGGVVAMAVSILVLLAFFGCVVLHELGHSLTARSFGIGVRRILLMPIGGMAEMDSIPRQPARELLITLAGPAVNFVIAAVLYIFVGLPRGWHLFGFSEFPDNARGFFQLLLHANLFMGLFNLLPIFPMDGGRIFRALLATRLPYLLATRLAVRVGKILAVIAAVVALVIYDNFLAAVLFTFILLAGEAEYRAAERRERDDQHWREMLDRIYGRRPPLEEPPVLGP
jgi:Zn-dependent protease